MPETRPAPPATPPAAPAGSAYEPAAVEQKWYAYWEAGGFFHADPEAVTEGGAEPFVIPMPPPNVTGRLHMGHALQDTVQDLLTRYKRMRGFEALWIPGMDHAGIATQNVVERKLREQGLDRKEMGREAFLEHVWAWKEEYGGVILEQKRRLGDSCDWRYERFTMDEGLSRAVQEVFVRLHDEGLVYRGDYLVNWDPENQTVISNEEVDNVERPGHLWTVRYPVVDEGGAETGRYVDIATTRPETIPADTAVAVHPDDERFADLVGEHVKVPAVDRVVPIIADDYIKMDFGAGALKVTPGHDENDYAIGQRHGLETVSLMNLDGTLNEEGGPYAGLDRFEARKRIVTDLEAAGQLVKTEDYPHTVPISSRSKAVIEPLLSPQWYVSMEPLAREALAVVDDGTVRFHPARWANEYRRWMEDIRDWPISRQLWWGHRIPVWYPTNADGERDEENFVVSVDSPGPGYVQDEDVLDTWFSSWLWPFATLGWPDDTDALRAFYPGSVLVSGYDILFFWIARMIMAGTHFLGEAPFTDVFVTGMIKDKQGRWMSKSLGNGIDPLDTIEQYGADGVRFTLAKLCAQGQDIRLDPTTFEGGRNFANKVWNAFNVFGRFLETDEAGRPVRDVRRQREFSGLTLVEQWMLTRLDETIVAVEKSLDAYRVSEAVQTVYDTVWRDFCDWYLELAKPGYGAEMDQETLAFSVEVFDAILRLLHPFMPFLTEELWWKLRPRDEGEACIAAEWPSVSEEAVALNKRYQGAPLRYADEAKKAIESFTLVQEVVTAVRQVRAQYNVPPSKAIDARVRVGGAEAEATVAALESARGDLERLAGLGALQIGADLDKPQAAAAVVVDRHEVFVPLAGMIDLDVERERLAKEIESKRQFLGGVEKKLRNEQFTSRAPEAVVEKERQKAADARAEIDALKANLADLG
ncbi:valine--tRNA ligase [Rubrivirga sp. S365]|uniref:Valine--tRNA ligase n=1 Tax=Rubrivirga litoralis TaxID=3075598 RepID=A0ABU3BP32_9BACT|nr:MULTISPECIES: valine--tRNA ligase [unclassified Rubrivirga]MDT0631047.1 valine--tRNA ligase [Rubrivirga sp. F394]MDT7855073.1 valine--tRNA ligase [Rubrivirga sp. S365]